MAESNRFTDCAGRQVANSPWCALFVIFALVGGLHDNRARAEQWQLVWSDEFDRAGPPDATKWGYELGFRRNQEAQYYTDRSENVRVENGMLVIEARRERFANADYERGSENWRRQVEHASYTSASLRTSGKAAWTYGRFEIRAKVPQGRGTWPAIWMLGANVDRVGWPNCGEIDIMEYVGFQPRRVHANVHVGAYNHASGTGKGSHLDVDHLSEAFHTYRLDWYPDRMEFFCDDQQYFSFDKESDEAAVWPFDEPQFLLLNLAIGGSWGAQEGIDDSLFPRKYFIEYVRVYQQQ